MSKKHLTYDDRLAIQAGLQKGLKVAQIARNIGKDRATIGKEIKAHRRLVTTSGGNNCIHHKTCTRIPDCRSAATVESASARLPAGDARRTARSTGKSSVLIMRDPLLSAIPVTTGYVAGCAVCSMTQSMPRSNTRRPFRSPAGESP